MMTQNSWTFRAFWRSCNLAIVGTILCIASALPVHAATAIRHLEPISWWVGMADPKLQLMVHGDNIQGAKVSIDYPGVSITGLHTTDNPNYLFIDLLIAPNTKAGEMEITFTQAGQNSIRYPYSLQTRQKHSAQREGFGPEDVIYLLTPDRFANGDPTNDTVSAMGDSVNRQAKGGRHGGDLQGMIDRLDYLQEMGFTQIWPMPVLENAMESYSYHGYSTTDYYRIDPRLGSNELYRELSRAAKAKGIGLIQDVVLNHIGSEHWWMDDMPSSDWINHQGQFVPTTHMREALHDPHGAEADKVGFSDGWFVPTMPDLNQRNPFLATYLIQNCIWWVEYAELSGIRVDTYSYPDKTFLSKWTERLMQEYPNFNIVGEEWTINPSIVAYWQKGSLRHDDYETWLPSVMDFPTQKKLIDGLTQPENWASGLRVLYENIATDFVYGDPYNLVVFADNHDMSRILSQLNEDEDLFYMAMTYVLTTRGIPQVFYGTELMMNNPGTDDHGVIRSDFPGGWPSDRVNGFTGEGLNESQKRSQQWFKTLLNWRKNQSVFESGKLMHYTPEDGVYVYFRYTDEQSVMVVMNKNAEQAALNLDRFEQRLGGYHHGIDVIHKKPYDLKQTLTVPAKTALILELSRSQP